MTKTEANKLIAKKLDEACNIIKECEALAEQYKVSFSFSPAYGMGGSYVPEGMDASWYGSDYGWISSSSQC